MSWDTKSPKVGENKTYTQKELDWILEMHTVELKEKAKDWVHEKAISLAPAIAEKRANEIAQNYIEKSPLAKKFEEDKAMIWFLKEWWAIPTSINIAQAMIIKLQCDALWIAFVDWLKWMCFINWILFIYWPVFLSLMTKNKYKIKFIEKTDIRVEVEISWPNWIMNGSFTKKQAELAGLRKNVYLKHPTTMLTYKAVRDAQKWLCPEVLWALPLVEEADEYPSSNKAKALDNSWTNEKRLEDKNSELKNKYKNLISNEKTDESI